ncbi:unnamed protein product [Calypogeia fissa]
MLKGQIVWNLIEHIIPVYVLIFLGYFLTRFKFILPIHVPGICRFLSILGVPLFVFHLIAFNDPYQISIRLVGGDMLQKAVALVIGLLWWAFAKNGKIDHVINFFMHATLPTTVLIGDILLDPLYGADIDVHGQVVTIIFLQCVLWFNFTIVLYEMRTVLKEMTNLKAATGDTEAHSKSLNMSYHKSDSFSVVVGEDVGHQAQGTDNIARASPTRQDPCGSSDTRPIARSSPNDSESPSSRDSDYKEGRQEEGMKGTEIQKSGMLVETVVAPGSPPRSINVLAHFWSVVAYNVLSRLKHVPVTHGSMAGFVYAFFAYK